MPDASRPAATGAAPRTRLDTPLDAVGAAAPPRKNGELVFAEPWESRVFGMALALHARGLFAWDEFRDTLIAEIARWERETGTSVDGNSWRYYERWQAALESLLAAKDVCTNDALRSRAEELAARPAGHDHH